MIDITKHKPTCKCGKVLTDFWDIYFGECLECAVENINECAETIKEKEREEKCIEHAKSPRRSLFGYVRDSLRFSSLLRYQLPTR